MLWRRPQLVITVSKTDRRCFADLSCELGVEGIDKKSSGKRCTWGGFEWQTFRKNAGGNHRKGYAFSHRGSYGRENWYHNSKAKAVAREINNKREGEEEGALHLWVLITWTKRERDVSGGDGRTSGWLITLTCVMVLNSRGGKQVVVTQK